MSKQPAKPAFDLSVTGREWTLSVLVSVYNASKGLHPVPIASGSIAGDVSSLNDAAMTAAQKWLRSQVNVIDAEWL